MSIDRAPAGFDSSSLATASFPIKRRGFDQDHVRQYLVEVADELRRLRDSEHLLHERLAAAEDRIAHLQVEDVDRLTSVLGDEAARLLGAARQSASERVNEADARASQLLANAETDALTRRDEAAADALRVRNDADEYARATRRAADEATTAQLAEARAEADRIVSGAQAALQAEIDSGRRQAETLVREAELMREQILRDLARRRKQLRVQVEQLRVARERLLATHGTVRKALDDIEHELSLSLPQARAAALAAGSSIEAEPELTVAELEDQLELARLAGFTASAESEPLSLTGELPVLDHVLADAVETSEHDSDVTGEAMNAAPLSEVAVEPCAEVATESPHEEPAEVEESAEVEARGDVEEPLVVEESEEVHASVAAEHIEEAEAPAVSAPAVSAPAVSGPADDEPIVIDLRDGATDGIDDVFTRIRESREPKAEPRPAGAPPVPPVLAPAEVVVEASVAIAVAVGPSVDDASLLTQRDAVLDPFEMRVARLLKRAVNEEQNRVQDAARRGKGKLDLDALLGTVESHASAYTQPLANEVHQLSIASQQFFALPLRGDTGALRAATEVVAAGLIAPLRAQLERACRDGLGDDERVDAVRAAFRDAKSPRADQVARELTTTVFNLGVAAGVAPRDLRWVVDPDAGCSPDCLDNALAGGVPAGERFPAGQLLAPSHPRCRCLIAPA